MPTQLTFDSLCADPAEQFDRDNPVVWVEFCKFTFELIQAKRKRGGAKAVFERMRWECKTQTTDPDYKLNNNYTAYYARKFNAMRKEQDKPPFFATRRQKK
jgi:hypothetical protein